MKFEFLKGVKSWRGEKLAAGIMFFHPDYGRQGGLYLPRSLRCLKGWKKLSPSRSRKPLVFAIWAAIAVELCRLGSPLAAALVLEPVLQRSPLVRGGAHAQRAVRPGRSR